MFSRRFLIEIAYNKGLSNLQRDVFVEKFIDARPGHIKSSEIVAEHLNIAPKSAINAMTKVYIKFDLNQPGPNKANILLGELFDQQRDVYDSEDRISQPVFTDTEASNSLQQSPLLKIKESEANRLKRKINKIPQIKEAIEHMKLYSFQNKLMPRQKLEILAQLSNLSVREVSFFFNAEPLSREAFIDISKIIGQSWMQIADQSFSDTILNEVSSVRNAMADSIRRQCGTLRTLDVETSIEIDELYVDVNILKSLTARQRKSISDLPIIYNINKDRVNRSALGDIDKPRMPGDKAALENQKMMIFGKPGSGKTTFLKHIAILCQQELFQPYRIPIFVQLRNYVDDAREIEDFNIKLFIRNRVKKISKITDESFDKLIDCGRLLLLLDGLDEVPDQDAERVRLQMKRLFQDWGKNRIIVTCRIAASEYTFDSFTEVEVSDFNINQVEAFSRKWFSSRFDDSRSKELFSEFMDKIQYPENDPIREIAVTPILLILTCLVFQVKGEFPESRYKLYEEGINILIEKWDRKRDIKRQSRGIYKELKPYERKALLSYIASVTFERSEYFFERESLWQLIHSYFKNIHSNIRSKSSQYQIKEIDQEEINIIINSIEVQHGLLVERALNIYSFSHLTFHEYFTAQEIANNPESEVSKKCIDKITDKRFLEVFLLASEMLGQADSLLKTRKKNIDSLLIHDVKQQKFLQWLQRRAQFDRLKREPFELRAFYFDCYLNIWGFEIRPKDTLSALIRNSMNRIFNETNSRRSVLDSDYALMKILGLISRNRPPYRLSGSFFASLNHYLQRAIQLSPEVDVKRNLIQLQNEIPDEVKFPIWWKTQSKLWTKNFRHILKKYRHLGRDWRFDKQQKQLLMQYYNAHIGLVNRLNTNCVMSSTLREELRSELLLPSSSL